MTDDILHSAEIGEETSDLENPESGADILHAPNLQQAAQRALISVPTNEDDYDARVRAKTLSEALGKAIALAKRDSGKNEGDTPEEADRKDRVQADAIGAILSGRHDYYGSMWNGRKPFASGAAYAQHMRNIVLNGPSAALSEESKRFYAADYDTQCRIAAEKEGITEYLKGAAADVIDAFNVTKPLTRAEEAEADEETIRASATLHVGNMGGTDVPTEKYKAAEQKVIEFREQRRREEIRSKYEAKLNRENAWNALTTILPTLSDDAQECAKAILDSDNNALPVKYYAKFNGLSERERNLLIQTRQLSADKVDSGFWNTIEDALIGAVNISSNILTAPVRQGAKFITMARNSATDSIEAGIDVNALAVTRQLLWQATGDPFAGGDRKTGQLPQLQFEQVCEEHGLLGESVIGAISTLPYMGAAMIPYAGTALIALEAMQEMDDHVALNGGDITTPGYLVSSFVLGGLYSYVEKLQVEKMIGGVSEQGLREGLLKGFYAGIKNRTVPRAFVIGTLSESLQEGLQNGIMAIHNSYSLNDDATRPFAEAFVEDFIASLGTMAIIGAGGIVLGHMKRSGWHLRGADGKTAALLRQEARSTDLTNIYLAEFAHNNMVKASGRTDEIQEEGRRRQQSALWEFWQEGGKAGLIEKAGVSDKAAENLDRLFTAIREAEGATAKADEALQEWNRGRGVTSAPKAGESGDIGQQYLEQLVGGAIRGEIGEEDFVGRLMDLGFSARGARDYATFTTLENSIITEQKAIQSFLQGRYEREAGSEDAQNADYEKVKGAIRDLDRARSVWAQGFGIYRSEEDGKIIDPGAAALEKFGFTKEDAKRISKLFHYERAAAFSPIALDGIRAMYERATRGKVSAKAAIASEFQGRVVRLSTGTDANGKPVYGDFIKFTRNGQTGYVQILDSKTGAPDFSKGNILVAESIAEATKGKKTPITAQQWMDATPAERENLWNQYHLYDEGFFTEMTPTELTVAADPSARVDSEQAKILLYGTITLATDPSFSGDRRTLDTIRTVDSSAGFHEIYHAWSYFMQQTGKWSEKDDEELQKKYGRAPSGGHNEEAAANALRAYINRRIEGRMTSEDEKSPFAKIFALAKQLRRHADEKRAKERAAATAEEAFFDQIIIDNFTGVGEISKQPEAPKPAENAKTSAPSAPQMPGRTDNGADNGATEPEKKPEPEEKPAEPEKPKATPKPAAQRGWTAYTPTGNVKVSGHYAVVNLSEVIHSNNPAYALYMRSQLRNRKDNKAEEDTRKDIVNNFQGERLLEAPDTANGAPIVFIAPDENGERRMFVLSGNGRILVLNELAERHMYDKYRNIMKAWAAENGLEVPEGETPVLVRVITDLGGSTLEKVADLSNTNSIQQYTEEEQARADAEVIKSLGIARLYHANANGSPDMTPGVNDDFFAEFIRGVGDTSLYNSDRSLTETARIRAVRALLAISVGQGERGRDVVKKLIEQTDTLNIVRQKNAAAIMAAAVAALETNDAYSIGPDVSRAMADYIDFAEKKKAGKIGTFDEYFAQMDLLDAPSEIAREILKLFGGKQSAADIAEYVNKYCEAAAQSDPTGGLFGEAGARTRIQIWNDAVKTVDEQRGKGIERHSISSENYGIGSSALNGPGFVDLEPGDTFGVIEEYVKLLVDEKVQNDSLGIEATIGSKSNANHLARKTSSFGDELEEAHKYAVKNVLQLFAKSNLGIVHHDKNGGPNDYVRAFTPFSFGGAQYSATITLRRDNGGDKLYTVEAVEIENAEGSPRTSDHKDRQEAQPSASLRDRIAYYVGDVNATQPKFVGRHDAEAFTVEKLLGMLENELTRNLRPVRHSVAGVDFVSLAKYYDGGVRDIARRLKGGDEDALRIAASSMARAIKPGDVLIPVPSHDGLSHDTLLLADAISRLTGSPVVEAIRGTVRDPIYDMKEKGYLPDAEDLGFYRAADIPEDRRAVFIDNVVGTGTTAVAARQALGRGHVVAFAWDHTAPHPVGIVGGLAERHSIRSLYTGSASDYEKPSLLKVGTGEGNQVYGWGLYASSERGVAEGYAKFGRKEKSKPGDVEYEAYRLIDWAKDTFNARKKDTILKKISLVGNVNDKDAVLKMANDILDGNGPGYENLYEQTFFTNRAPGDESHLLNWYEPVSEEQAKWIVEQAKKEGIGYADGDSYVVGGMDLENYKGKGLKSQTLYKEISRDLGSPQAASEFLARADIDGIKYPVDSYGKTVKDGDTAGWNYVSFRDDNISVDHKWVDGVQRYSIASGVDIQEAMRVRTVGSVEEAGRMLKESGAVNRPLTNKTLGITASITGSSLSKMMSKKATKKSRSPYLHALAVANADKIFEAAFSDATHPDSHGRKEVAKVHRLGSMVFDPKSGSFEPVLVTVIEYKRDGENVYTLEVVDVGAYEKNDSAGQLVAFADGERQTPIAEYVRIIAHRVSDFNNVEDRHSFAIGEVGAANLQDALFTAANLKKARELLSGRDWSKIPRPERIRIKFATGWEVGADGKWRMEQPDLPPVSLKKFKRAKSPNTPATMPELTAEDEGAIAAEYEPTTLGNLFPKAELFSYYPWLKSTKVLLGALPQDGSVRGSYNEDADEIKLRFSKAENAETIHTTLVHEIQHAIQRIEDFARGGNLGIVQKIFMERFKKAKEEAWQLYHEEHDLANRYLPWNERYKYTGWPKRHPERIAALEKLRKFDDFRDWELRAADFKKKWKHGIDFFTESDFTAMGRAFKSSFKDYTKLAGEVEARNAAARHYKTILDLRGAYAEKSDFPVLLEDTEDVDRRYQTLLNGAMEQFEKLKSQEDRDARHSFAGLRAANLAGVTPLADAEALEKRGEDRETIFKLTGWWRGVDGHWRVELPFHGRFELEGDFDQGAEKGCRTISDYFEWPELFSSYPELRDVEVRFEDMPDEIRGDFDPKTKTITINKSLRKESANIPAKLKVASVMVHEIQHAIQSIENHARGGDPEQFLTWDTTKIHEEIRRLELQRELTDDADEKESIDEMIQEHEIALQSDAEDAERKYYSLAGEVEARNAAERFFESPSYRLANPPWTTQDTFDNQQILDFDNGSGNERYSIQAWPENFPKVKIVTTLDFIKRKHEDLHKRAKAGSLGDAIELVNAIIGPATIKGKPNPKWDSIRSLAEDYPGATLVPVQAEEATGHNMIPFAYAYKIYEMTGLKVNKTVKQVVRANHTGSDAFWRMTHRPEFVGNIMRGRTYIIIDDHVTMGGTLSELRKHIQDRGGKVVVATTLTASRFSDILSLRQGTLEKLAAKFGKDLGKELHEAGIANVPAELTEAEARYLLKLSPDTLRDRLNGSALERRALGSLAEGSVQARVVRSAVLPGAAGGVGDRANGSSGSGRSSASHVNDFPGFSEYKDPDGNFGPTRWAKAEIFNGRISKELNKVIDDALAAGNLPGEAKLEELTKLVERAKETKEGKLVLERYKSGDSFDGSDAQKNDPKRQAVWQAIRQKLILDPVSSANNEGLEIDSKTGKPKNASTIEASNTANPDLPAIANDATASYDPVCDRRLDIVVGPPAAGKSSVFVDRLSIYYRSRVMDSDAIKKRLPGFDKGNGASFVHEESSYINKMLLAELLEANKGENIVLPIVGSSAKKIRSYIDMFRNRGYSIYLHNNYVPIVHAFARALVRTTSTGRWIAPEVFLDCLDRPSAAFEEVKDEVDGWDEFSNDVPRGMEPIPARGNYKDPAYGTIEFAGEKIETPSNIKVTPQLVFDFANALDLEEEKPIFPRRPTQDAFDFGDAESRSRHAIRSDLQENANKAAEEALTNYLTYFRLSHSGKPRANTIARMGLAMGMNVVSPRRLLEKAESRAEQVRGTLIEKAAANGDVATTLALLKREDGVDETVSKLIAGGISKGGELTHKGVGQINSIIGRRVEQMMRDFTAASLADMEGETGLDIAAEILEQNPDAFADEVKKTKGINPEKPEGDEGSDTDAPVATPVDESNLSDRERYERAAAQKRALEKVEAFIAAAKARAEENKAKAEERRKRHETVDLPDEGSGEGGGDGLGGESGLPRGDRFDPTPKNVKANFKTKEEFAAFMRIWAEHKFDATHGTSTIGKSERDKLFAEFYRITVRQELQDLADKLLAPKDDNGVTISRIAKLGNGARVHVNRRLAEMEKGVRPDTIERMSADIFAFINSAAIRVSRTDLVKEFKKTVKEKYIKGAKYDDLKLDTDRRVTGWVEEAARYICRVCDLSKREINGLPSQLAAERKELHDIINRRADVYDESGREIAKAAVEDMETKKAMWKLALLDKYGAMTSLMPGEILDLQNQAIEYLENQAADLEQLWRDTRAYEEGIRRDLTSAIVAPGGQRYKEKGWLNGRLFDALNGLIRLRLQHLTRFASDADRQKASDAINKIIVMLGDGETQYNRALQDDRRALFEGLGRIFQKPEGGVDNAAIKKYLNRMTEPIPKALAQQISNQGFADSMTYGQMLQLLVSLEQRSFREAIEHNGRQGQAELIRNFETTDEKGVKSRVFTAEDNQFIEWLRAFYAAKRDVISPVTLRMVGQKVDSPDPLYCPVKRSMEDRVQALAEAGSSWDPIAAAFTRRIRNNRDFDEQASIIGMFFDRSDETAKLLAWAERGTVIRGVFTSVGVQSAIRRAFGPGELRKIMTQLLATFNGGESRKKSPGELAAVDKALNFTTYAYLGFNPLSAIKQTTSFTVWANALPGGFRDLWKYMSHFDRAALKHLKESDEYKIRYGNDVGSGQDLATKGLNENPGMNPVARMLSGAGMWLLKKGDFAPGGWIAQGLYKDLLNKHLNEGMEFDAADRLAITETFNMLEETQQSGRTYNTNMLTIEHGRIGRLLTQFATSPLQQLQYETQAFREWRDMIRYNMGEKKIAAARRKLVRAVVINHLLLPAALNFVTAMFKLAMGDEPPWEKDGYHWSILTDVLMGQFSRVFFIGAFSQTALKALFMREYPRASQMLPVEGVLGMAASVCITAHDVATLNAENIRKDLERMLKATAPTRIPYGIYRRLAGDSDMDRKKAKAKAK